MNITDAIVRIGLGVLFVVVILLLISRPTETPAPTPTVQPTTEPTPVSSPYEMSELEVEMKVDFMEGCVDTPIDPQQEKSCSCMYDSALQKVGLLKMAEYGLSEDGDPVPEWTLEVVAECSQE